MDDLNESLVNVQVRTKYTGELLMNFSPQSKFESNERYLALRFRVLHISNNPLIVGRRKPMELPPCAQVWVTSD